MASNSPIALILGAGSNIGQSVARAFAAKGYRVALAARRLDNNITGPNELKVKADFSSPTEVVKVFDTVRAHFGIPTVVVYNASSVHRTANDDPLSLGADDFEQSLAINTTSPFIAAQQAVSGWRTLSEPSSPTFIYTGNILNEGPISGILDLGVGKAAMAHIIESASTAYKDQGYKFYFADERTEDGGPVYSGVSGSAAAEVYTALAQDRVQGPWQQTFVKEKGYVKF